jgi:mRNA interferase RelE/StbE
MLAYRRLRAADPEGAKRIARAVGSLSAAPRPPESSALGGTSFRRLRLGNYRVLYEISGTTVRVMHVGRVLPR